MAAHFYTPETAHGQRVADACTICGRPRDEHIPGRYYPEDVARANALAERSHFHPPIPHRATQFLTAHYGYAPVAAVIYWEWSTTFGRWGALVRWPDESQVFTYPRPDEASHVHGETTAAP
jgi:hypothetical protein